jgi:2,3-dihydroxy-p-cumate/2,3-dihydroxybenzoate 3,4-dioxygenase
LRHRIALYPSDRNGLLDAAVEVEALDQIMQNTSFMQESQVRIVQGPGREAASRQMFLHVEGPDGLIFPYVNGITEIDGKPRLARQFPLAASSLCDWGSDELGATCAFLRSSQADYITAQNISINGGAYPGTL